MKKKIFVRGPVLSQSGYGEQARFALRCLRSREDLFDIYINPINWGQTGWIWEENEFRNWLDSRILETQLLIQQKQLHPDKFALSDETEQEIAGKQSTLVNESYDILKHPVQRGKVLLSMLHNVEPLGEDVGTGDVPMELLMQVMEAREEIENLNSNDEKGASIIISKTIAMVDECANTFEHVLEEENNIEEASNLLVRLQYLCKIEEEIRKKCDELLK